MSDQTDMNAADTNAADTNGAEGAVLAPKSADQLFEVMRWAVSAETSLDVVGRGSKSGYGRPVKARRILDVSGLSGIDLYEPEELVMTAKAGTPLVEIEEALAAKGQELAFEPADYGPLFGKAKGQGSVGGTFAANLSGPRRMKIGAARDHLLGFHAVSGRGEAFKSGGRVVKNVTGYDLCKLMTGAFGTLGVLTELTFKVMPRAETTMTLAVDDLGIDRAVGAMTQVLQSAVEATGAAYVPAPLERLAVDTGAAAATAKNAGSVFIRLEGFRASVADRATALEKLLGGYGIVRRLDDAASRALWLAIRDGAPFRVEAAETRPLWRVCVPPASATQFVTAIRSDLPETTLMVDWGGGLVWVETDGAAEAGASAIRGALARPTLGGHATLVRADAQTRTTVPVFQPPADTVLELTRRIKESFDPLGILNPGRMYEGI